MASDFQRFRFEQYFQILEVSGYKIKTQSFFSSHHQWRLFYSHGSTVAKAFYLSCGTIKRCFGLTICPWFDYIFIHREVAPIGPPIFEWLFTKAFQKKIIYDFDDTIWLTDKVNEQKIEKWLRWRGKVGLICKWSYRVSCGNAYLAAYSRQFNSNTHINPTTIDTNQKHNRTKPLAAKTFLTIGWTGSHSTLKYLLGLEKILAQLEAKFEQIRFLVIADKRPPLELKRLDFIYWNRQTELEDLLKMDIGVMPLPDDEWTKGKCGFKALQYMALEIPAVASPVGVNNEIITHGINGFLCKTDEEWFDCLERLINDPILRNKIGAEGRKKVMSNYSVTSNASNFLGLFS